MGWLRQGALACLVALAPAAPAAELYVTRTGHDANPGSREQPCATIQHAADVAQPGDTVHVARGTYRETVRPRRGGEPGRPVRFVADGAVTITGTELLRGAWQRGRNGVWELPTDRRFNQFFYDGRPMPEARWPNATASEPLASPRATAGEGTNYTTLVDSNLPPGDWNGALVLLWPGGRWLNTSRRVTHYVTGHSLQFDRTMERRQKDVYHSWDPYAPIAGNPYLLYGCLAALDSPGEWWLDADHGRIYFLPPDGRQPAEHTIEVGQRARAFDLHGLSDVEVTGFRVLAATLDLTDAHDCRIVDCHLRFTDHVREVDFYDVPSTPNVVTGRHNELQRCSIGWTATTALRLGGEGNRLVDCVIFGANYLGTCLGAVDAGKSQGNEIRQCTIACAGRDLIEHRDSKQIRIVYNDLWQANLLSSDSGAVYCWGTDGQGGVIAYNWIHDCPGDMTAGVYLDNFCRNFVVHHNLIWNLSFTGLRLNCDALNHLVCNNTVLQTKEPFGTYAYEGHTPTEKGTRILNNLTDAPLRLTDPRFFVQGALGPEVSHNQVVALGPDGVPPAGSPAIDAGLAVPGLTDGFLGQAPDLGAYEVGGERWRAGATWLPDDAPRPPARDLTFRPQPPITESTMLTAGLRLWLDAADSRQVLRDAAGRVTGWADRSGAQRTVVARGGGLRYVPGALAGRGVVRGDGTSCLTVGTIRAAPGPVSLFLVSQAMTAGGPGWQRLCGVWVGGATKDWLEPNWMVPRVGDAAPRAYPAQVFTVQRRQGGTLERFTLFGPATGLPLYLAGDIAEVLLYDRALSAVEADAVVEYLTKKWALH